MTQHKICVLTHLSASQHIFGQGMSECKGTTGSKTQVVIYSVSVIILKMMENEYKVLFNLCVCLNSTASLWNLQE